MLCLVFDTWGGAVRAMSAPPRSTKFRGVRRKNSETLAADLDLLQNFWTRGSRRGETALQKSMIFHD